MKIQDSMRCVNTALVERGLMRVIPHSICFDRYFTEEEMAENREYSYSHSREEWDIKREETRRKIAEENHKLMEYLKQFYKLGQYDEDCDDYVLWFWCNVLCNTTNGKQSGRDYSYVTLTFNKDNGYEANIKICEEIRKILVNYKAHNIQAIFEYSQVEVTERVKAEAEKIYNECIGKYVTYGSATGKIEKRNGEYLFKKKYAKKYAYRLRPIDVCNVTIF